MNIAGPSSRTIRRMNLGGDFNKSAKIQVRIMQLSCQLQCILVFVFID